MIIQEAEKRKIYHLQVFQVRYDRLFKHLANFVCMYVFICHRS